MDSGQNKYADLADAELVVHAKAGELAAFGGPMPPGVAVITDFSA